MHTKILVTGAPGNVGTEVVQELRRAGVLFRIGAFDVAAAQRAFGSDADIQPFDFLRPATFAATFEGIERMFLVRPPALANVQRDIAPALLAARAAGVRHVVFLSLQGVEKNRVVPHYRIEKLVAGMGFDYTFLRASFFMQNLSTTHAGEIRERDEIALPVGKAKTSFVDVRDLAAVAARALTQDGYENSAYTLTGGEALDYEQVAAVLSATMQRPIRYREVSAAGFLRGQLVSGRKLGYALVVTMLYTITRMGNAATVTDDVQRILGRPPVSLAQFAYDYRSAWELGYNVSGKS